MELRIKSLEIDNFKGVKHAEYQFGDITHISGRNASGKTTIVDSIAWLMFNRDSHGNTPQSDRFHEKPLDLYGNELHNLETSVYAEMEIDGRPFNLRRIQRENWVKRRGNVDATYQGNTSTYFINDLETKVTDFNQRINAIANGDLFMLLMVIGAFNDQSTLDDKQRRALLMRMSGGDVDGALLDRPEYQSIRQEMTERGVTIEELRRILMDRRNRINKELTLVPAKIDEVVRAMPEITEQQIKDANYYYADSKNDLERCQKLLGEIENGNVDESKVNEEILKLEQEIVDAKQQIVKAHDAELASRRKDVDNALKQLTSAEASQKSLASLSGRALLDETEKQKILEDTRNEYKRVYAKVFAEPGRTTTCKTCGQHISDESWERMINAMRSEFEAGKKEQLEEIRLRGKAAADAYDKAKDAREDANKAFEVASVAYSEANDAYQAAELALREFPTRPDLNTEKIEAIENRIAELKTQRKLEPDAQVKQLKERISELNETCRKALSTLALVDQKDSLQKRKAELEDQQVQMGRQKAETEVMLSEIDKFVVDRCRVLEESINARFDSVRWKLFSQQINGAIVDCCECMVPADGAFVSYHSANTAAQVNADIEIIEALCKFYDVVVPVFVDGAERVNYITKTTGQLITLSVSKDETIQVRTEERRAA